MIPGHRPSWCNAIGGKGKCNGYNYMHSIQRKYKWSWTPPEYLLVVVGETSHKILFWYIFFFSCHHDTRNRLGSKLEKIKKSPFKGFFQKMGNKLSCSCGPLKIKGYRFDDPWAANTRTRRNGHLLRSVIPLTQI